MKQKTAIILENIRSAHNVGSIFRTADGAGVSKIYLTGYTPLPTDRFGRPVKEIAKTSLGATASVSWEGVEDTLEIIHTLQKEGWNIVAVEQTDTSIQYDAYVPEVPTVYVFGNEVDGISEEVLRVADAVIEIPMMGNKESLNVSVSAGVILYQDLRQRELSSPD